MRHINDLLRRELAAYFLAPVLFGKQCDAARVALQLRLAVAGAALSLVALAGGGVVEGVLWQRYSAADGTLLHAFAESVRIALGFRILDFAGTLMSAAGMLLLAFNIVAAATAGRLARARAGMAVASPAGSGA